MPVRTIFKICILVFSVALITGRPNSLHDLLLASGVVLHRLFTKSCMGCKRFFLKERKNVMFLNKIDVPYCLVVFFVVCPRLRPFWSVFGELALFWCSTAKRKKRGRCILWLRKSQENFLVQWLIHILKTVHLQQLKRMPRSELTRHAKGIPFVNENVYEENTLFCQKTPFDFLGIGHLH